jgi:hypothetical protein
MLRRRLAPEARMGVLRVDGLLEPRQFPSQVAGPLEVALQQRLLEPGFDTTQSRTNVLDGSAGETEIDGALTRREFVVHGCPPQGGRWRLPAEDVRAEW